MPTLPASALKSTECATPAKLVPARSKWQNAVSAQPFCALAARLIVPSSVPVPSSPEYTLIASSRAPDDE